MVSIRVTKRYLPFLMLLIPVISILVLFVLMEVLLTFTYFPEDSPRPPLPRMSSDEFYIRFRPFEWENSCTDYKIPLLKEDDVRRIVVIGESSVYLMCSFDHMKSLLESMYPYRFEIINLGVPSTTTAVMKDVVDKAISYDPDYIIFYFGNNEYVEFSQTPKWFFDDVFSPYMFKTTRLLLSKLHAVQMRLIRGDSMRRLIEWRFRRNLQQMIDKVKGSDVKLFIAKIAANSMDPPLGSDGFGSYAKIGGLADYPRFAGTSGWLKRLEPYNQKVIKLKSGLEKLDLGETKDSIDVFKQLSTDMSRPDPFMEYYLAQIYYHMHDYEKAKLHFQIGIDIDDKPFRITSGINEIIGEVAEVNDVSLIDVYSRIEEESLNNITGYDLFIDHVHLNNRGMELAQEELANGLAGVI